jgi:hypothetical protein
MNWLPLKGNRTAGSNAGLVTALWRDEGVSFACWAPRSGSRLVCLGSEAIEAGLCDARLYREHLARLRELCPANDPEICWVFVEEGLPRGCGDAGADRLSGFPDWMRCCWSELRTGEFPGRIVSATACMEEELRNWPAVREAGTGLYFPLGERCLFLALTGEGVFKRFSRRTCAGAGQDCPDPDWIQQTRMLCRSRTGVELRRILLPGEHGSPPAIEGLELCTGILPPAWVAGGKAGMEPSHFFLHACVARTTDTAACRRRIDELEKRWRSECRERTFRMAACLLLGTWMLALLGACRSRPGESGLRSQWEKAGMEWQGMEDKWIEHARQLEQSAAPYRMVGQLAVTLPEGVGVNRIRLKRSGDLREPGLSVLVEGTYSGRETSDVFHDWMDQLKAGGSLHQVENLRFERRDTHIAFQLEGHSVQKGTMP